MYEWYCAGNTGNTCTKTTQVTPSLQLLFYFVTCTKLFPAISWQSLDIDILLKKCKDGAHV